MKRTHYEIFWEILTFCKTPRSFTSIQPARGMISSLGRGMQALSIAINATTPGHSMAL